MTRRGLAPRGDARAVSRPGGRHRRCAQDRAVGGDEQHVEADAGATMARIRRQPAFRRGGEARALPRPQRMRGFGEAGPRLHLDEGEQPVALRHQVEFPGLGTGAARQHDPAFAQERGGGHILAGEARGMRASPAQAAPGIHGGRKAPCRSSAW